MALGSAIGAIGGAIIGGGASLIAGNKSSKAIDRASDAQTQANAQSVALQRDIYNQNRAALNPFQQTGIAATNQINALLGLPQIQRETPGGNALLPFANSPYGFGGANPQFGNPLLNAGFGQSRYEPYGGFLPNFNSAALGNNGRPTFVENQPQGGTDPRQAAENAFQQFRDSTGYQFRVNEGQDALRSRLAARGIGQSGAALKELENYRQNVAAGEFGNYFNALQGQQNIGFGAASAQAGVGQNFANNVTSLNTSLANNLGNAAIAQGNVSANTIGGVAGALGNALGYFSGSSFGG